MDYFNIDYFNENYFNMDYFNENYSYIFSTILLILYIIYIRYFYKYTYGDEVHPNKIMFVILYLIGLITFIYVIYYNRDQAALFNNIYQQVS